jgi:F-type H+-transporting ATPase subunit epsilon
MADNIQLEVVTPEKDVVNEEARSSWRPALWGIRCVVGHTPFMTTLKVRHRALYRQRGKERFVFVSGGFAEALPDKVTILAESDYARAKAALNRALHRMRLAETKM